MPDRWPVGAHPGVARSARGLRARINRVCRYGYRNDLADEAGAVVDANLRVELPYSGRVA